MTLGLRGKLIAVSLLLVTSGMGVAGLFLDGRLRALLEGQNSHELTQNANMARLWLEAVPAGASGHRFQELADTLGRVARERVTIVDAMGRVRGDSGVPDRDLAALENHGDRPEIQQAWQKGFGISKRYSATLKVDMLYVAVPVQINGEKGALRFSRSLSEVEVLTDQLHLLLLVAGLLALASAIFMSVGASHLLTKTLRQVISNARAMAEGDNRVRLSVGANDELRGLAGTFNRMAEDLEQVVAKLAEERDRFEVVFQQMVDGILLLDREFRVTHINKTAMSLLRFGESPIGKTLLEVIRIPGLHELVSRAQTVAEVVQEEFAVHEGCTVQILTRATSSSTGRLTVLVLHDVTSLRRLERIREDFVTNASHELRTPVSILLATAETLRDGAWQDAARGPKFIASLHRNAVRLSALVSDLLDLSRIDSGRFMQEPQEINVHSIATAVIESLQILANQKKITLEMSIEPAMSAWVDEFSFNSVLFNLVDNAVKYTPTGGHVSIRAREEPLRLRIEVRDDGPGIEPKHRPRIFERFYRIDKGRSREMGGTGLGLAIVKHLVQGMGGEVGVEPNQPRGSVFWVCLPLRSRP